MSSVSFSSRVSSVFTRQKEAAATLLQNSAAAMIAFEFIYGTINKLGDLLKAVSKIANDCVIRCEIRYYQARNETSRVYHMVTKRLF